MCAYTIRAALWASWRAAACPPATLMGRKDPKGLPDPRRGGTRPAFAMTSLPRPAAYKPGWRGRFCRRCCRAGAGARTRGWRDGLTEGRTDRSGDAASPAAPPWASRLACPRPGPPRLPAPRCVCVCPVPAARIPQVVTMLPAAVLALLLCAGQGERARGVGVRRGLRWGAPLGWSPLPVPLLPAPLGLQHRGQRHRLLQLNPPGGRV